MTDDRVIPCNSEEMRAIDWDLKQADNKLIDAETKAMEDTELSQRINQVRRLITQLIEDIK